MTDTIHQILAEMSVLSEVAAARAGDVVHGGERDRAPKGPPVSLEEHYRGRWLRANGPVAREAVRREAAVALVDARRRRPPVPDRDPDPERGSFYWKCLVADDDRPVDVVVRHFAPISRATVYRYRLTFRGLRSSVAKEEAA